MISHRRVQIIETPMEVATCQSMCFANQSSQRNSVGCSDWGVSCVHSSNSPLRVSRSCACTPPQRAKRVGVSRQKHFGRAASASRRHPSFPISFGNERECIMSALKRVKARSAKYAAETGVGENLTFRMLLSWRRLINLGDNAPPRGCVLNIPC